VLFRSLQSRANELDLVPRCCNSFLRLFLEHVEYIDYICKSDRVDRAISITTMVVHNFEHAAAAEAFQCLGGRMLIALLRSIERLAHDFTHLTGKGSQVLAG
jgi:hypothetical protein